LVNAANSEHSGQDDSSKKLWQAKQSFLEVWMPKEKLKVVVLGASDNPERFSNRALKLLLSHGHQVLGISPRLAEIEGVKCFKSIDALLESGEENVHTLTMYVGEEISTRLKESILRLRPKRIIFNPGTENAELENACTHFGIDVLEDCTLVMLNSNRF
jgi:uncharacterized protein